MSRVLVKIARDLNVGTAAIVEHLNSKGFNIENKPNARITDDMYDELILRFQKPAKEKSSEEDSQPKSEVESESHRIKLQKPVVLGKIDLTERLKQRIEKIQKDENSIPIEKTESIEDPKTRADTPELRGLKILGKIDTDKFERPRKSKRTHSGTTNTYSRTINKELEVLNRITNKKVLTILLECYHKKLTFLDLGNNSLTLIPEELELLTWIKGINFGNRYRDFVTNQWTNSKNSGLKNNFSKGFLFPKKLIDIAYLCLNECSLSTIEPLIGLENLEELWLNDNKIKHISNIHKLKNISLLSLSGNEIYDISPIGSLQKIKTLNLNGNQIENLDPISRLKLLNDLSLGGNNIDDIEPLAHLKELKYLDLSNNKIEDITLLSRLKNLELLDLSNNQIESIESLSTLSQPNSINLRDNPIEDCPPEIWESGDLRIIKGYFEARKRSHRSYNRNLNKNEVKHQEVKLILVGNSGTGKTQLRELLCTGTYNSERSSTHGIEVSSWKKYLHSYDNNEYFNEFLPSDFTVNIWDFGGQEYYHGTHQLFLSNKAIYVLLWEIKTNCNHFLPTKISGNIEENLLHFDYYYWLENIRYYAPNSPIFIVQNKVDEGIRDRINEEVFETYKINQDAFYISLHQTALNESLKQKRLFTNFVADLCETIITVGEDFLYYPEWINIRDTIKTLGVDPSNPFNARSDKHGKWIALDDFKEVVNILEPALSTNENELLALITWLDFTGCIIYYPDNPKLNTTIFLDPQWITSGIYQVLNDKILGNHGVFSSKDFNEEDFPNVELFIDLMEQMEIVFKNPNNPSKYIAPQYLDEEHPIEDLFSIAETGLNQSSLKIRVPLFFYRKLMHRLIIYFGAEADVSAKYYWKHGVIFITKAKTRCLIKGLFPQTDQEGIILIGIENTSEAFNLKKEIFGRILIILSNQEKEAMNYSEPESLGRKKQDDKKKNFRDDYSQRSAYTWYENHINNPPRWLKTLELSIGDFGFVSFIELCKSVEERLFKIATDSGRFINLKHFNFLFGESIPRPIKVFLSYANENLQLMRRLDIHLTPLKRLDKIETWTDRDILPGNDWDTTIQKNLDEADLVLLLITADFIASKYIWEKELAKAIMKHEKGEVEIIPILLQPVDFESLEFAKLKMIPSIENGELKPVALWESMEQGFSEVAKAIRTKIEDKTIYD